MKKAFETCGLYPFNADKVDYSKCILTRRKQLHISEDPNDIILMSHDAENSNKQVLVNIEKQIPEDVIKCFVEAYE